MSNLDTLSMLKAALAQAGDPTQLAKADTFVQSSVATVGLQDYDLSPAVLNLYPVLTPLRNMIPRVGNGKSVQANWKAVTAIDTSSIRVGVSEGHRGSVIGVQTKEYFAAYRTLGAESAVTDEAALAAADFDDVRARAANTGLQSLMLAEEQIILGGNTSYALGVTPTPVLTTTVNGGAIPASTVVSVICVALTLEGRKYSSMSGGIPGLVTRTTADGFTESFGGGSAQKSASQTVTVGAGGANAVTATVAAVRGAYSYAWFAGTVGNEQLAAITYLNTTVITALPTGAQLASSLPASDNSTNTLVFDGLLTMAGNPANGSGYTVQPAGQGLTSDGTGGIVEFDTILQGYWDNLRISPSAIYISSQEMLWIRRKVLSAGLTTGARFSFNVQQNQIVGGGMPKGYLNPFAMGNGPTEIPLILHPNMPAGTVLFLTKELPYAMNNIDNMLQIRCRRDYYQTEWPRKTRAYEYGVYTDEVLQCFFMPGMWVLTNLSPA